MVGSKVILEVEMIVTLTDPHDESAVPVDFSRVTDILLMGNHTEIRIVRPNRAGAEWLAVLESPGAIAEAIVRQGRGLK